MLLSTVHNAERWCTRSTKKQVQVALSDGQCGRSCLQQNERVIEGRVLRSAFAGPEST